MLRSTRMYNLCFRSLQDLPLPSRALTALVIESIIGRLLSSQDVIVCGYVWMSNYVHIQIFSLDCGALMHFHGRLKKRLTDFLNRFLGSHRLNLCDTRTTVGEVLDLEATIERLVYTYLNPARAGLVNSIDEFKGCNTWREFMTAPADVNALVERDVPWILATDIEPLSRENPSLHEEQAAVAAIREQASARITNKLKATPFIWLEAFKVTDPVEIEKVRRRIISRVREEEAKIARAHAPARGVEGVIVTDSYVPKKGPKSIHVLLMQES